MVNINYRPFKELIVAEFVRYDRPEDLARLISYMANFGVVGLSWAEGVAFLYQFIPPTTEVLLKEFISGRVYCMSIFFALMPEFKPVITTEEGLYVPVFNMTPNAAAKETALWLKNRVGEFSDAT